MILLAVEEENKGVDKSRGNKEKITVAISVSNLLVIVSVFSIITLLFFVMYHFQVSRARCYYLHLPNF